MSRFSVASTTDLCTGGTRNHALNPAVGGRGVRPSSKPSGSKGIPSPSRSSWPTFPCRRSADLFAVRHTSSLDSWYYPTIIIEIVMFTPTQLGTLPLQVDGHSRVDPLHQQIVEHAWLLKATMRWVRDDRSPLNAFRWFVWDGLGIGDPPSRVERAKADKVIALTAGYVPILPNLPNH